MKLKILIPLLSCLLFVCHVNSVSATTKRPATNNYTITEAGVTCVVMTTGIQLRIPYMGDTKNFTSTMMVPSHPYVNGSCDTDISTLNIYFNASWRLSFIFTIPSKSTYQMSAIELSYETDTSSFPNISSEYSGHIYSQFTMLPFGTNKATLGGSYSCPGETNVSLNASITLTMYDLQYMALATTNSTWFTSNDVQQCTMVTSPVPESNMTVAVSVGIALGVMIVLVVLLYIIVSNIKSRRSGY